MFTFLHGYLPKLWAAQEKAGLIRKNDGIRFCQNIMLKEEKKFNVLAAKNGELYNILAERRCPFYIDRLQGGVYIDEYPYDKALLEEYKNLLGENFWGFQMHEWLSNYYSDVVHKLDDLPEDKWTKEEIEKHIYKKKPFKYLMLESMTAEELADTGKPKTEKELYRNMTAIYKKRLKIGELLPCDSHFLAYGFELSVGAKRIMPEVGAQSPDARIQICYARGMTRDNGKSFGVYYEPWGGYPFSTCCYNKDGRNEWGIGEASDFPFVSQGANGGSSRSLQRRIFLYGFLCGAEFMSEEWGLANVFTDWESFELSPYGLAKKDFINFVDKYTDIGEKLSPIAAVLPKDLMVLDIKNKDDIYCGYKSNDRKVIAARDKLRAIFSQALPMIGTETQTLKNSDIPDVIDILNNNDSMLDKYEYLIDLTGGELSSKYNNVCVDSELKKILRKILPCYVDGNAHWLINKCTTGGYYLTIFNHSGVCRTVADGEYTLKEGNTSVILEIKGSGLPHVLEGNGNIVKQDDKYRVDIPSGGFAFIKFHV